MLRSELKTLIGKAADTAECETEDRDRLVAAADSVNLVASGIFIIEDPEFECGCPATVAGYYDGVKNQWREDVPSEVRDFTGYFDNAIYARADLSVDDPGPGDGFVEGLDFINIQEG